MLLNSEVMLLLQERGAASTDQFSRATNIEKATYEYLYKTCSTQEQGGEKVKSFHTAVDGFGLASAEVVQLINMRPTSAVDVHLIVESIETRYGEKTDEIVDELLEIVRQHLTPDAEASDEQLAAIIST